MRLWFDVGNERYTTRLLCLMIQAMLWFDVGNERYTTFQHFTYIDMSCGLMQETKDIQLIHIIISIVPVVV